MDTANLPPLPEQICFAEEEQNEDEEEETEELDSEAMQDVTMEDGASLPSRLHPLVAEKICELVAQGHNQVYTVRKQLRYDSDGFKSPLFYLLEKYLPLLCQRKCLRDTVCVTFPLSMTSRTTSMRLRKLFS